MSLSFNPRHKGEKVAFRESHAQVLSSVHANTVGANNIGARKLTMIDQNTASVTRVIDTTGVTESSYTTMQEAIDDLALMSGDTAYLTLTDGQTLTLTDDLDFSALQRKFRHIVVQGGGRTVYHTDTVASVAVRQVGTSAALGWTRPTLTTAGLTANAHIDQLLYNATTGQYHGINDNGTNFIDAAALADTFRTTAQMLVVYDVEDQYRLAFAVDDSLVIFEPTSIIAVATRQRFVTQKGASIEFKEIQFNFSADGSIFSKTRIDFNGCIVDRASLGGTYDAPPLDFHTRITGCVIVESAGTDNGLLGGVTEANHAGEVSVIANSVLRGGQLTDNYGFYRSPPNVIMGGNALSNFQIALYGNSTMQTDFSAFLCEFTGGYSAGDGIFYAHDAAVYLGVCDFIDTGTLPVLLHFYGNGTNAHVDRSRFIDIQSAHALYVYRGASVLVEACTFAGFAGNTKTALDMQDGCRVTLNNGFTMSGAWGTGISVTGGSCLSAAGQITITGTSVAGLDLNRGRADLGGIIGASNTGFGIRLQNGSSLTADSLGPTTSGTEVHLGAEGVKLYSNLLTPGAASDRNDYANAATQNCSAMVY